MADEQQRWGIIGHIITPGQPLGTYTFLLDDGTSGPVYPIGSEAAARKQASAFNATQAGGPGVEFVAIPLEGVWAQMSVRPLRLLHTRDGEDSQP